MARSDTVTLLALDRYAAVMSLQPYHFNNLFDNEAEDACKDYWTTADHDELADGIDEAEGMLRDELEFDVAPVWHENENVRFGRARKLRHDWWNAAVATRWCYINAFGRETCDLAEADAATGIIDGDTDVQFMVDVSNVNGVSVTDPAEIRVFYRTDEGAPEGADPRWEIRELSISITAGTATIEGPVYLFTLPAVLEADEPSDAALAASYAAYVDVYRCYADTESPVTLLYNTACAGDTAESWESFTGTGKIVNPILGYFMPLPSTYSNGNNILACSIYEAPPEILLVDYRAGYPLDDNGHIYPKLEKAVVRLANTLFPDHPCNFCELAGRKWHYDHEAADDADLTALMKGNPFGFRRGAVYAARVVRRLAKKRTVRS